MGASDFSKLPHIGEALRRKEDYRFLTGAGNYTDDNTFEHDGGARRAGRGWARIISRRPGPARPRPGLPARCPRP